MCLLPPIETAFQMFYCVFQKVLFCVFFTIFLLMSEESVDSSEAEKAFCLNKYGRNFDSLDTMHERSVDNNAIHVRKEKLLRLLLAPLAHYNVH